MKMWKYPLAAWLLLQALTGSASQGSGHYPTPAYTEVDGYQMPSFRGDIGNFYKLVQPRRGWWWNPQEGGTGLNLDIQQGAIDPQGGGLVFVSYYVYEPGGEPVWYTWAGYWRQASWQTWHDTGVLGTVESLGAVQKTVGGRPIGGPQQQPSYVDAGLGTARLEFTSPTKARLLLGGESRELQWMEWGDDLQDSSRCDPANPSQCRYSIMEGYWWMKGFGISIDATSNMAWNSTFSAGFSFFLDVTERVTNDARRLSAFSNVPAPPFEPATLKLYSGSADDGNRFLTATWVVARDSASGEEWLIVYGGLRGYGQATGYVFPQHFAQLVYKIVYIDEDTALAIGYDTVACFMGYDHCAEVNKEFFAASYFVFRRGKIMEEDLYETGLPFSLWRDYAIWSDVGG